MDLLVQYTAFVWPWISLGWPALRSKLSAERYVEERRQHLEDSGLRTLALETMNGGGIAVAMFIAWRYADLRWFWFGLGLVSIALAIALLAGHAIRQRLEHLTGGSLPATQATRMTASRLRIRRPLVFAGLGIWTYAWRHLFAGIV